MPYRFAYVGNFGGPKTAVPNASQRRLMHAMRLPQGPRRRPGLRHFFTACSYVFGVRIASR
jgi:hypothetical protein